MRAGPPLRLLRQAKLASLLAPVAPDLDRWEASGIVFQNGVLWLIFDNLPHVAAIHPDLVPEPGTAFLARQSGPAPWYWISPRISPWTTSPAGV